MEKILYYLVLPLVWLISIFPISILYVFSDLLYVIVFHLIAYRKKVTINNLQNAFPEKSEQQIYKITVTYYHYLCDLIVEIIKGATMSREEYEKRWTIDGVEVDKIYDQGRSCIFILGHYGNWEAAPPVCTFYSKYHVNIIYKPIRNSYFDQLMNKTRIRFDNKITPLDKITRRMIKDRKELIAYAFVSDQTPAPNNALWMKFLNQETAVFTGVEKIARKMNIPVIYVSIQCKKRGHYHIQPKVLFENPKDTQEGEIMRTFMSHLEDDIKNKPEYWLWSHRRWKHKKPDTVGFETPKNVG